MSHTKNQTIEVCDIFIDTPLNPILEHDVYICMEEKRVTQIIRVLPKGQITLPHAIRGKYHIEPYDIMELIPANDAFILKVIKVKEDTLSKLREREWGRYEHELIESFTRLEKMPYNGLPRLCR